MAHANCLQTTYYGAVDIARRLLQCLKLGELETHFVLQFLVSIQRTRGISTSSLFKRKTILSSFPVNVLGLSMFLMHLMCMRVRVWIFWCFLCFIVKTELDCISIHKMGPFECVLHYYLFSLFVAKTRRNCLVMCASFNPTPFSGF